VTRAVSVCAEPGCPNVAVRRGRCQQHAPPPWAGSRERRDRLGLTLPPATRRRVRDRARHRCQSYGRHVPKDSGAVDHVRAGDPSSPLQLLCDHCHGAKTRADLATMRKARSELEARSGARR
jgi:5-methylcytosine-specific restriction protein A